MSAEKLLYVITQAPYSNATGQDALEAIMVAAAFEQDVSVLFMHDGVFQLKGNQDTTGTDIKQITKTYRALEELGVNGLYVYDLSLSARGLSADELIIAPSVIDQQSVSQLIAEQFRVFTF